MLNSKEPIDSKIITLVAFNYKVLKYGNIKFPKYYQRKKKGKEKVPKVTYTLSYSQDLTLNKALSLLPAGTYISCLSLTSFSS